VEFLGGAGEMAVAGDRLDDPSKEFLRSWYGRIGYRLISTRRIDDAHPHLAPLLATACDLEVHEKPLR
jgi:hypothetical protein